MTQEYCRAALRVSLAQICQNLGWHSTQATPIELLTDVLERYLLETAKVTHRYAEQFGRTYPTLDDLGLAFGHLGVQLNELEDYVKHVEPIPFAHDVISFPAPKKCNLHFPRPGNREVSQRDDSIPEYLPPMYPEEVEHLTSPIHETTTVTPTAIEATTPNALGTAVVPGVSGQPGEATQSVATGEKRPLTSSPDGPGPPFKRMRLSSSALPEEAGHSQYEMKSMVINQVGDVTPTSATVGKLPDAKTPPAGFVRKVASKGPTPKGPVKCLTKELQKEVKSDKKESEDVGKKKDGGQKTQTTAFKKDSAKEKEKTQSPKPGTDKKDSTKSKSKTKKTGSSPGRPPRSRSKSPARAKSPKGGNKAPSKDQAKEVKEKVNLCKEGKAEVAEPKAVENLLPAVIAAKKEIADASNLNYSANASPGGMVPLDMSKNNKSQPEESPEKRRARLEAIDNAIDAVIKRSARDAEEDGNKSKVQEKPKEETKLPVPEKRLDPPPSNEDTNPAIMNIAEVKNSTPIKLEPVEQPLTVPIEKPSAPPIATPITSPLTSPETKRKKGRPPKAKGRGGRAGGSPKGRKPSVEVPQILQVPQIPPPAQPPLVVPAVQAPAPTPAPAPAQAPAPAPAPVPAAALVLHETPVKVETEVKEKFAIFDFPESPPVPKPPPPPPPEIPPVSMAIEQTSSNIESKHGSHKEKEKHREKSKEHKKEKKEKKKDKEKKKKNKDKDRERSKNKDKSSKSDIPLPGFTIGKLKIKLGSSPSSATVSYSSTPQILSPKREAMSPSASASPSQRPEIPKLVIKPLPPMPSSQEKDSASPKPNPSTSKPSKKESKGSFKKESIKKEQTFIPERVKTPPVPVAKQPNSPVVSRKEPSPVPQPKISTPTYEKGPEKTKEKSPEMLKKPSPEKKKKSPEKASDPLFSEEPPVLKMEVMDEPPVLTPQPPPCPQTPTPPPREVTPPPAAKPDRPAPQRFTPSPRTPHVSPSPSPPHSPSPPVKFHSLSPLPQKSGSMSPVKTPSPSHTPSPIPSPIPSPLPLRNVSHSPTPTKPTTPSPTPTPAHSPSPGPNTLPVKEESSIPPMPPPSIGTPALNTKASLQRTVISETVGTFIDASGQKVWICPACKMPDDGSPMIGCDICDDWYHWDCIGMKESPPEEESWYCVKCVAPQRKTPRPRGRGRGRGRGRKKAQ